MREFESHHRLQNLARVPGIGLLNRTCKSWVERHEVQLLRGLPKSHDCVAQAELEQASHKREVGGSTPPTATKKTDCEFLVSSFELSVHLNSKLETRNSKLATYFRAGDVTTA